MYEHVVAGRVHAGGGLQVLGGVLQRYGVPQLLGGVLCPDLGAHGVAAAVDEADSGF